MVFLDSALEEGRKPPAKRCVTRLLPLLFSTTPPPALLPLILHPSFPPKGPEIKNIEKWVIRFISFSSEYRDVGCQLQIWIQFISGILKIHWNLHIGMFWVQNKFKRYCRQLWHLVPQHVKINKNDYGNALKIDVNGARHSEGFESKNIHSRIQKCVLFEWKLSKSS